MTIQREYLGGPFVVQCNDCLDTEELHGETRRDAVNDARERGYKLCFEARAAKCAHCAKAAKKASEEAFRAAEDLYEQRRAA